MASRKSKKSWRADAASYQQRYGFSDSADQYSFLSRPGLNAQVVRAISKIKKEPAWLLERRLRAFKIFQQKKLPKWGADLTKIDFKKIHYYLRPTDKVGRNWREVPKYIKNTFERLGIPQAEKKMLAGVGAQYESEMIYHSLQKKLQRKGVIFLSLDEAVQKHPELVKKYLGTVVSDADNKFAALNGAVWSGGSFIYVPKGVKVELPLQAYFRINLENSGQFERTLIIADEGSEVHYIEGCSAPVYTTDALHAAVVEIVALPNSRLRYTTIQNWSQNVYNLVTKRALAHAGATVEWLDGNLGSKTTMKYPAVCLVGRGARGVVFSLSIAGHGREQDTGAKMIHLASDTSSLVVARSVAHDGGIADYRGLVKVVAGAKNVKSKVQCDALLFDDQSRADTYPTIFVAEKTAQVEHEASIGKVNEDQLAYLASRGLDEETATALIINGFFEPIIKKLPLEYAVEFNRLIELEMSKNLG